MGSAQQEERTLKGFNPRVDVSGYETATSRYCRYPGSHICPWTCRAHNIKQPTDDTQREPAPIASQSTQPDEFKVSKAVRSRLVHSCWYATSLCSFARVFWAKIRAPSALGLPNVLLARRPKSLHHCPRTSQNGFSRSYDNPPHMYISQCMLPRRASSRQRLACSRSNLSSGAPHAT